MAVFINTCVYPKGELKIAKKYYEHFGEQVAFEILSKFDEDTFGEEIEECIPFLKKCRIGFHGPVWLAEHSAKKGTEEYERTMEYVRKTAHYAQILNNEHFVYHLNNCKVDPMRKEEMLKTSLENLEEVKNILKVGDIYVENTGTKAQGNVLLNQEEFTELCLEKNFDVLIDLGHANANGWDIKKLIRDLASQIRAYHIHNNFGEKDEHNRIFDGTLDIRKIVQVMKEYTPSAKWILEYTTPEKEGAPLFEDVETLLDLQ